MFRLWSEADVVRWITEDFPTVYEKYTKDFTEIGINCEFLDQLEENVSYKVTFLYCMNSDN